MKEIVLRYRESLFANIVIVCLALLSVILLIYELSVPLDSETLSIIYTIDLTIAIIFLIDFSVGFIYAEKGRKYLKENWPDFLASIPVTGEVVRSFRFLRMLRLIRIIAQLRKGTRLTDKSTRNEEARYVYLITIVTVVLLAASTTFFSMEYGVNPMISNFGDALWWSVAIMTTVGVEDIYPLTWEGRVISAFLMLFGVAVFGTVAGLAGTRFLKSKDLV